MSHFLQPSIILLREGVDTSQGKPQLISNINACCAIVDTIKTTLGPRGMDKLIYTGSNVTVSNDGATLMKLLDVVHPAAKTLVEIAMSQDSEVGDGTTSVVVFAGELLKEAKSFVEDGVAPQVIVRGYRNALKLAKETVNQLAVQISDADRFAMLEKCAATALNSKLVSSHGHFFAKMIVEAVSVLEEDLELNLIGIKKVNGGSLEDSVLVKGVSFKKTFSYAGFEQQPKAFKNPKILCLNVELELKAEKDNAEIRIKDPAEYQSIVEAEWRIIYQKLEDCVSAGASIILSRKPIGDLATQYFADRNIFCAGRVLEEDMTRVCKATGASVQSTTSKLTQDVLGTCGTFEEKQVGGERFNFFTDCVKTLTATIILRGGGDHFIDEAERSIHDSIMIVRRAMKNKSIVAGGGALELEVSRHLREHSRTIQGKQQLIVAAFARALEVIPWQVADNAGLDSTLILNKLRQKHAQGGTWYGVDIEGENICDTMLSHVWEPALVKLNSFAAATEAACSILTVDETIKHDKREQRPQGAPGGHGGHGH